MIELDTSARTARPCLDAHGMQPDVVLNLVGLLGELAAAGCCWSAASLRCSTTGWA